MFCSKWSPSLVSDQTEALLNVKIAQLDQNWQMVLETYQAMFLSDSYSNVSESVEQKYSKCSDSYQNCKAQMTEALELFKPKATVPSTLNPATAETNSVSSEYFYKFHHDTQDFYGGYEEWPAFRDMFTAVYIRHPKLTPAQKLYHLRYKTKGQAGIIVKQYPLSDESFELAWEL